MDVLGNQRLSLVKPTSTFCRGGIPTGEHTIGSSPFGPFDSDTFRNTSTSSQVDYGAASAAIR